jgi:hypothetical protein
LELTELSWRYAWSRHCKFIRFDREIGHLDVDNCIAFTILGFVYSNSVQEFPLGEDGNCNTTCTVNGACENLQAGLQITRPNEEWNI